MAVLIIISMRRMGVTDYDDYDGDDDNATMICLDIHIFFQPETNTGGQFCHGDVYHQL